MNRNVLIVDDEAHAVTSLVKALRNKGLEAALHATTKDSDALRAAELYRPEVAVVDLCLDETRGVEGGMGLLKELIQRDPTVRVIILTGHGTSDLGVRALNMGAASFLEKPADVSHLMALITDGIKQCQLRRSYKELQLAQRVQADTLLVGSSAAMTRVRDALEESAATNLPVFIGGETGTGKSLCAKAIHVLSSRNKFNFVRYQPTHGALDLVTSDLFGHVKGAFTGADSVRTGLLKEANHGTLFLDEVDELPVPMQVTLLGVLQDGVYRSVGSNDELRSDFRLISASNHDPELGIASGKMRRDFFHRIAHTRIDLPPLRDRKEDLAELSRRFLAELSEKDSLNILDLDEGALTLLSSHSFPGNIRELQGLIEQAAFRAARRGRASIGAEDLRLETPYSSSPSKMQTLDARVDEYRNTIIKETLRRLDGNVSAAAKELGVSRSSLRYTLDKFPELLPPSKVS